MVERNLAKVEVESSRLFSRSSFQGGPQGASKQFLWRGSKEVMQRPAKPFRRVRFPSSPPDEKNSPLSSGLFFCARFRPTFCLRRILYNAGRLSRVARRADDSSPIRQPHAVTDDFLSVQLRHGFFLTPAGMAAPDDFPSGRHFSVPTLDLNQ